MSAEEPSTTTTTAATANGSAAHPHPHHHPSATEVAAAVAEDQAYLAQHPEHEVGHHLDPPATIVELCKQFYTQGWVFGTGGSISIRHEGHVYVAPSGVMKERIRRQDVFRMDEDGGLVTHSANPKLKPSSCLPLFIHSYKLRDAGACIHTHSINAMLVTLLYKGSEFYVDHQEMIKGIEGNGYHDRIVVPIIENEAQESMLADSMEQAILDYPEAKAVLVRRHGVYVWGDSWEQAKKHAECYDYLFEAAVKMSQLGVDPAVAFDDCPDCPSAATKRAREDDDNDEAATKEGEEPKAKRQKTED